MKSRKVENHFKRLYSAGPSFLRSLCVCVCVHFKALVLYILAVIIQRERASCVELGVIVVSVESERNQPGDAAFMLIYGKML